MSNLFFLNTYLHVLARNMSALRPYGAIRPSFARLWRLRIKLRKQHYLTPTACVGLKVKYARSKYLVAWLQARRTRTPHSFAPIPSWLDFNWGHVAWLYRTPDTVTNPLWGQVGRGFPKLLFHTRIREYTNFYLRPRWYRRARLRTLIAFLRRRDSAMTTWPRSSSLAAYFNTPIRSVQMTYRFYLSKRWCLT